MNIVMQAPSIHRTTILTSVITLCALNACNSPPTSHVARETTVAPPLTASATPPPAPRDVHRKMIPLPLEKRCHRDLAEYCQNCPTFDKAREKAPTEDHRLYKAFESGSCQNWRFVYTHTGFSGVTEFFNPDGRLIGAITTEDYPRPCKGRESDLVEHSFGKTPVVDLQMLRECASDNEILINLVEE